MCTTKIARLALCSAWLVANGCGESERVTAVVPPSPARRVAATGRIEGLTEADVASKISGRIAAYVHGEGDEVDAGAPVVRLEDRDLEARMREAAARERGDRRRTPGTRGETA